MARPHSFNFDSGNNKFVARPIEAADKEKFLEAFNKLSVQSRYLRFFAPQKDISVNQLKYFTEVDGVNHIAWIIIDTSGTEAKGIAVGRIVCMKDEPTTAEVAITVIDEYQRMGLGAILFSILNILAANNGIKVFRYHVLRENKFVVDTLHELGILEQSYESEIVKINSLVRASHRNIPDVQPLQGFIQTMKKVEALIY
jgi:hypothetical protein